VQASIAEACTELGCSHLRMPSGAFHDAMFLARKMPAGMLFVPSRAGVSHHPDEYTKPEQIDAGVEVLAGTLARLARAEEGHRWQ
jgi:beta-ureidopropionase / N-carbamoyl-L-amino-acid hydrolase